MLPHIDLDVPVVVVSNFVEAHYDFLSRSPSFGSGPNPIDQEAYHADRTLLWVGDPKLVLVSHDIPHAEYLCNSLGYAGTRHAAPKAPTPFLSRDILYEQRLMDMLVDYAGPGRRLQIVPYATTPDFLELVDVLRCDHGIEVLLPECPRQDALWLRNYVDTKAGFHHLAGRWLPNPEKLLPEAYPGADIEDAAEIVHWFHAGGRACIAKPDTGESGLGSIILRPSGLAVNDIVQLMADNSYWGNDEILVEEFVDNGDPVSPSVELFVPRMGEGEPQVTYVSEQLFQAFGEFSGVLVSRDQHDESWYSPCVESGLRMAYELQARGYAGHFDVDAIVDDVGNPRLLELNARRTGGTHVHDFGRFYFGPDYLDKVSLLSWESLRCDTFTDWHELRAMLDGIQFPLDDQMRGPRGIIFTIASALKANQFGVVIVGEDRKDVLELQQALRERLAQRVPAG